jgi:D-sedoheptulose 7-phosphate isomerase
MAAMNNHVILDSLCEKYPLLENVKASIMEATTVLTDAYRNKGKLLVCGNGGSCSDANHIVGELMKGFEHKRPLDPSFKRKLKQMNTEEASFISENLQLGLPAISLTAHGSLITAVANDMDADLIYAQQVAVYGDEKDVFWGISTSGNSENVINAMITARAKGMRIIGLTGKDGGRMKLHCDVLINVPGNRTADVQELHLPVYHAICRMLENHFYLKNTVDFTGRFF